MTVSLAKFQSSFRSVTVKRNTTEVHTVPHSEVLLLGLCLPHCDSQCICSPNPTCLCANLQALNEGKCIAETLQVVQSLHPPPHEIIVVDGGSTDRSVIQFLLSSTFAERTRHQQTN